MYFFTSRQLRRGTAITETLLILLPLWLFFMLLAQVLFYWEERHIDKSVQLETQLARQTLTGVLFDKGRKQNLGTRSYEDDFHFYLEDVSGKGDKLPAYDIYITGYISDKRSLKLMSFRGNNSWLSFLWLRGQYFGKEEQGKRVKWFEKAGHETLNKARKPLMLGS